MSSWTLTIVDSRGKSVAVRQGEGTPPASLAWNGRGDDGSPAWPGLTYSYRLDTVDPAGNRRTTVGRGFDLPTYRLVDDAAQTLVFAGDRILSPDRLAPVADLATSPLMFAAASWLNQAPGLTSPIEIRATARSQELAAALAAAVDAALAPSGRRRPGAIDDDGARGGGRSGCGGGRGDRAVGARHREDHDRGRVVSSFIGRRSSSPRPSRRGDLLWANENAGGISMAARGCRCYRRAGRSPELGGREPSQPHSYPRHTRGGP